MVLTVVGSTAMRLELLRGPEPVPPAVELVDTLPANVVPFTGAPSSRQGWPDHDECPADRYCVHVVDRLICRWPEVVSRAENVKAVMPRSLRPTKGRRGDPMKWADMAADIEASMLQLRPYGRGWTIVDYRLRFGPLSLGDVARALHVRYDVVLDAYAEAVETMAAWLEGAR